MTFIQVKNVINTEKLRKEERRLRLGNDGGYTPMNFLRAAARIFGKTNKKYFGELIASLERDPLLGGETIDVEADEDDDENQVEKSGQFSTS